MGTSSDGHGTWPDVLDGLAGAGFMTVGLLTPFLRGRRSHWGLTGLQAQRDLPGDELIPQPRWAWTHGIEVRAPARAVWPWIAQIGAGRGGFYSYQWLEKLIGCRVRNAASIHPDWAARPGGELRLHPKAPPLRIVSVIPGRSVVAYMPPVGTGPSGPSGPPGPSGASESGRPEGSPPVNGARWITASWLFHVEPTGSARCRVISRYRCASSSDLASRLQFGPALIEPISFAMDRRMLIGIRQRAERDAAGD